ncbi:hypothetical protein F6453_2777 [Marinobacter nauticus]|uniref:Uncharacterized protein n=1 Tax=Marinobacter nauticus TaxID=2743 RepID=A0A833JN70_MARNT|nr:hypothetical protein F6453_2777 [Marinobacter nauticus]
MSANRVKFWRFCVGFSEPERLNPELPPGSMASEGKTDNRIS